MAGQDIEARFWLPKLRNIPNGDLEMTNTGAATMKYSAFIQLPTPSLASYQVLAVLPCKFWSLR